MFVVSDNVKVDPECEAFEPRQKQIDEEILNTKNERPLVISWQKGKREPGGSIKIAGTDRVARMDHGFDMRSER